MLTYDLTNRGKTPLYDALYKAVKADILSGKLKAGEKLPSKRELAEHLKISKVTVENAYAQLKAEGYIYSLEKKGYFVDQIDDAPVPQKAHRPSRTGKDVQSSYIAILPAHHSHR